VCLSLTHLFITSQIEYYSPSTAASSLDNYFLSFNLLLSIATILEFNLVTCFEGRLAQVGAGSTPERVTQVALAAV
jgi:hypothetical protein